MIDRLERIDKEQEEDAKEFMELVMPALSIMRGKKRNFKDPVPMEQYKQAIAFRNQLNNTIKWAAQQPHIRHEIDELHMDIVDTQKAVAKLELAGMPDLLSREQARLERLEAKLGELE